MSAATVSEFVASKCDRLLTSGAVTVTCGKHGTEARVVGDTSTHLVVREADGRLRCTCPARADTCSHRLAVERVTGGSRP